MAVEISQHQFSICQKANVQFCDIHAPFQPLANPPSCITALYAKTMQLAFLLDVHFKLGKLETLVYPHK